MAGGSTQSLTGTEPVAFHLDGVRVSVKTWHDVLVGLCTHLYGKHGDDFSQKVLGLRGPKRTYFSRNPSDVRAPAAISDSGIYVGTHWEADDIVRRCKQVLKVLGYDANRFQVEVADSGRHDVRTRRKPSEETAPRSPRPPRYEQEPAPALQERAAGPPVGEPEPPIGKGREQLSDRVRQLSPAAFERLCARLLDASGYTGVTVTGTSGDRGIDGRAKLELGIEPLNVPFQAKRWTDRKVGADHVRTFAGGLGGEDALGIYITTSRFTDDAVEAAKRSMKPIVLIDGQRIVDLMTNAGLGVKSRPVVEQVIDEQFFRSLE